jgi:hypothetical protein
MASRRSTKRKRTLRPRAPARVRKRTRKTRSHHHPELWGLGMTAVGMFLASVLWLGWNGGPVGTRLADWLEQGFGSAAYVVPLLLIGVGGCCSCAARSSTCARSAPGSPSAPWG